MDLKRPLNPPKKTRAIHYLHGLELAFYREDDNIIRSSWTRFRMKKVYTPVLLMTSANGGLVGSG